MVNEISVEELIKKFDNVYPVKITKVPYRKKDGTMVLKSYIDIDYEEGDRIRENLSSAEKEGLRSIS